MGKKEIQDLETLSYENEELNKLKAITNKNMTWIIKHHENHDVLITIIQNLQREQENDFELISKLEISHKHLENCLIALAVTQFATLLLLGITLIL